MRFLFILYDVNLFAYTEKKAATWMTCFTLWGVAWDYIKAWCFDFQLQYGIWEITPDCEILSNKEFYNYTVKTLVFIYS